MANDVYSLSVAPAGSRLDAIAEGAFVALLLLVFVTLSPFQPPADVTIFGDTVITGSGAGDAWRQIAYLSVFGTTLFCAACKRGLESISAIPLLIIMLLLWCLASSMWAAAPDVTMRRAILAIIIVASAMISVDNVGAARALTLWRYVLGGVLIVNWISIPFIATARHLPGELDPALVGNWRGLYGHKNTAGAVSAITAILFLFSAIERKRWTDFGLFLLAVGFVEMSQSKTSLGMLPVALAMAGIYRWAWKRDIDRLIVVIASLLLIVVAGVALFSASDAIMRFLEDPNELTGRTAIWAAEVAYIRDHPLLGAGFGSFADTGGLSPLHDYLTLSWVGVVSHGHSGYLQLLVTIGGVGFVLAMLGLILFPAMRFLRAGSDGIEARSLLLALFLFGVLHNILESDFLESDGPAWVSSLIMLALLRLPSRAANYQ